MANPYLEVKPEALAGIWGMRAAELMPTRGDLDDRAAASRDTAFMLLAGAMRVANDTVEHDYEPGGTDQDAHLRQRRVRFEVLKRATSLAIPEQPELWLLDAQAKGLADVQRALASDEGLCEALRYLQQVAWIGGRWHTSSATTVLDDSRVN